VAGLVAARGPLADAGRARGAAPLERAARFVAPAAGADRHEGEAVRSGDRAAGLLGIEAEKRPGTDRHLLTADAPGPRPADDDGNLLLVRADLVVLMSDASRRQLEPVDAERLNAELAPHEADGAAGSCSFELVRVDDAVPHSREAT